MSIRNATAHATEDGNGWDGPPTYHRAWEALLRPLFGERLTVV